MKKVIKRSLIVIALAIFFVVAFCGSFILVKYVKYQRLPLHTEALTNASLSIEIFAKNGKKIEEENSFNSEFCKIEELSDNTKNAFISIEDKDFYKHNGVNKKRIVKAMLNNLKSGKFKEGASTITQQLIKNTHLTSEKTIDRKLKEIALAKKLEKTFSKDKILESYLNIIFFGDNCYGLESASGYYFDKSAKDLTLEEACTLAGIIKSPTRYSPIKNPENCIARRNLVLREMERDGLISEGQKVSASLKPLSLKIKQKSGNKTNTYSQSALDEASKILGIPEKHIAISGYKIHTYLDEEKQNALKSSLENNKIEDVSNAGIVIDNSSHGIVAYNANSNLKFFDVKRQPGSCIKPILVYAPALNENVISPSTQILDEEITIGDYKPVNVTKRFDGYMSVEDAVKNSVNIPAIKTMSYIGIETGKQYAEKMGLSFDEKDDNYTLALGGMSYGISLKTLTNAFSTFANAGTYSDAKFVQYITDKNDRIVYLHRPLEQMVLRADSSFLMTKMLEETAKSGTAKKLASISHTQIASKTGTVGNRKGNTDAYNISYTPEETIGVWFGTLDNTPTKVAGGNQPTSVILDYISSQKYEKTDFEAPSGVVEKEIDLIELEANHKVVLANPETPKRYTKTALFSRFNLPNEMSQNFSVVPEIKADCSEQNGQICINLQPQRYVEYQIFKDDIPFKSIKEQEEPLTIYAPFGRNHTEIKIVASYENAKKDTIKNEKIFPMFTNLQNNKKSSTKWYI